MIHITCYKDKCETPNFVIPPPNTHTVIAYSDNIELGRGTVTPAIVNTSEAATGVADVATFAPVQRNNNKGRAKGPLGLPRVQPLDDQDYLVVYCDSGHKNYIPFKKSDHGK